MADPSSMAAGGGGGGASVGNLVKTRMAELAQASKKQKEAAGAARGDVATDANLFKARMAELAQASKKQKEAEAAAGGGAVAAAVEGVAAAGGGGSSVADTRRAGMFTSSLGKRKTHAQRAAANTEVKAQEKRDRKRQDEIKKANVQVIQYIRDNLQKNADVGGHINWTDSTGGGAAAAGGGGNVGVHEPGSNIFDAKGAMIFFINEQNQILYGKEGIFLKEGYVSNLLLPLEFKYNDNKEKRINLNDWYHQLVLSTAFKDYILPIYEHNDSMPAELFSLDSIEKPILVPLDWQVSKIKPNDIQFIKYDIHLRKRKLNKKNPIFGVPKGNNKDHENAYNIIIREVWEEVGVDLRNLPQGRLQIDPSRTKSNYVIYYLRIDNDEQAQIESIITQRNANRFGEMYDLQFQNKLRELNQATLEAYDILKVNVPTLQGGRRRRITRKRTKKNQARRTRRR